MVNLLQVFLLKLVLDKVSPLSPHIFIICLEFLSRALTSLNLSNKVQPIHLSKRCPPLSYLFYADDAIFLTQATSQSCLTLKHLLHTFCVESGQTINLNKSCLLFSPNTPTLVQNHIQSIRQFPISPILGRYLGVEFSDGSNYKPMLNSIISTIGNLSIAWLNQNLSMAGRLTLIASILDSLPNSNFQAFLTPLASLEEINKLRKSFLWNHRKGENKMHHFSFPLAIENKVQGGLGVKGLLFMNKAFLGKKFWKIWNT